MDAQKLITMLKEQHIELMTDLSLILRNSGDVPMLDSGNVVLNLEKFKAHLLGHINLEAESFYPDYIKKKISRGEDVIKTKLFIQEMDNIAAVVMKFLEKYSLIESIKKNQSVFKLELMQIIETLKLRLESEEDGVFDLYLLMK